MNWTTLNGEPNMSECWTNNKWWLILLLLHLNKELISLGAYSAFVLCLQVVPLWLKKNKCRFKKSMNKKAFL